jgi:hypothetical protein
VIEVSIPDPNNQTISINFFKPLKRDQDFKGLVSVENTSNLKYTTMGNVLKVFFDNSPTILPKPAEKVAAAYADSTSVAVDSAAAYDYEEDITNKNQPEITTVFDAFLAKLIEVFEGIQSLYNNRLGKKLCRK